MKTESDKIRSEGKKISFIPTMGALHEGHISLVKKAKEMSDIVIVSIFVNPTQFAPNEDFEKYPRDIERDTSLLRENNVDYLFYPGCDEMYPIGMSTSIHISEFNEYFEAETRPTHFDGVALVVSKLFNIVKPHIAIFGQKDFQQTLIIKQIVRDLNFDIEIVIAPTLREPDGLAMSSRNIYLSLEQRKKAGLIYQALHTSRNCIEDGEKNRRIINSVLQRNLSNVQGMIIDYAFAVDANTFESPENFIQGESIALLVAVYLDKIRLIDNEIVKVPEETVE